MSDDSQESFAAPRARKRHRPVATEPIQAPDHDTPQDPPTWRDRHFATVMGVSLGGLLLMVMLVQAC